MIIIISLLLIYIVYINITLSKKRKKVINEWQELDNLIKKRNDLIPNLLAKVKEYSIEDIDKVNEARNKVLSSKTKKDKITHSNKLTNELGYLFSLTEENSDLKTDGNFLTIQSSINDIEDQINNYKRRYNILAINYKNKLNKFKIIAHLFRHQKEDYIDEEVLE